MLIYNHNLQDNDWIKLFNRQFPAGMPITVDTLKATYTTTTPEGTYRFTGLTLIINLVPGWMNELLREATPRRNKATLQSAVDLLEKYYPLPRN